MSLLDGPTQRRLEPARSTEDGIWILTQVYPEHDPAPRRVLGTSRLAIGRRLEGPGWQIADPEASRHHVTLSHVPSVDVYRLEDAGSTNGTSVGGRRVTAPVHLAQGAVIRIGSSLFTINRTTGATAEEPAPALAACDRIADRVAPHRLPVLIHGETGVGKERLALRIHEASRRPGAFVAINCGAANRELISSELFGHVAGAYSGAGADRDGLFVRADRGTIFLDEIAELPLDLQPALLRVLQEGRVRPLGADDTRAVDVRVLAATHADLEARVAEGRFRDDLLARIQGVTIEIPPLRARREEILPLLRSFLTDPSLPIDVDTAEALLGHDWPQNVRELQHTAMRLQIFGTESLRRVCSNLRPPDEPPPEQPGSATARERFVTALRSEKGNVAAVCRVLGCHRQQVYRWLSLFDLDLETFRK